MLWQILALCCGARHLENADLGARIGDAKTPLSIGHRLVAGIEQKARNLAAALDHLFRRLAHDYAGKPHRAARMRAAADRHDVSITLQEAHPFEWDAEPLADALGKARFVPLPARQGTDDHIHAVVGAHDHLGPLPRFVHGELDIIRASNTSELAALLG